MAQTWNILVVDDEEDVHLVTSLSLKHKTWQERRFNLITARSAAEARGLVEGGALPELHVAIVDCVMETQYAGLELCVFLRERCPASLRIILRTGQPGAAPEETILNGCDIDFYLAKTEATDKRLFAAIRAALRSAHEISSLLGADGELARLTSTVRTAETSDELTRALCESLGYVDAKHGCRSVFFANVAHGLEGACPPPSAGGESGYVALLHALVELHREGGDSSGVVDGALFGLANTSFLKAVLVNDAAATARTALAPPPSSAPQPTRRPGIFGWLRRAPSPPAATMPPPAVTRRTTVSYVRAGVVIAFPAAGFNKKACEGAFADIDRIIENWQIAHGVLCFVDEPQATSPRAVGARPQHPEPDVEAQGSLDDVAKRRAEDLWQAGVRAVQENNLTQAEADFTRALAFDPAHADSHRSLGRLLLRLGRQEEAASHLRCYLDLIPNADDKREIMGLLSGIAA